MKQKYILILKLKFFGVPDLALSLLISFNVMASFTYIPSSIWGQQGFDPTTSRLRALCFHPLDHIPRHLKINFKSWQLWLTD